MAWEWLKNLYRQPAERRTTGWLWDTEDAADDRQGGVYVKVRLVEMHLGLSRDHLHDQVPLVQSVVSTPSPVIDVPETVGPDAFQALGRRDFRWRTQFEIPLTSPLPWNARAGEVGLLVGLVAVREDSVLRKAASLLNGLSSLIHVPQLSAVTALADKVADGAKDLFEIAAPTAILAIQTSVVWERFRPGFLVMTSLPESEVPLTDLAMRDRQLWIRRSGTWARAQGFDFLVIEVSAAADSGDAWESIATIRAPRDQALAKLQSGNISDEQLQDAEMLLYTAIVAAGTSPDLTRGDRLRVAHTLRRDWDDWVRTFVRAGDTRGASVEAANEVLDRAVNAAGSE